MALIDFNTSYIRVKDFTGREVLSTYALEQTPLTFYVDTTLSKLISSTSYVSSLCSYTFTTYIPDNNDYSNVKIRWDFGDDTYQIAPTAVHTYKYPGEYKVSVYLLNEDGKSFKSTYEATINIVNLIEDKINFQAPSNLIVDIPAGRLSDKLTLERKNSYQSYNILSATGYTFSLYASGTGSYYYSVKNYYKDKWAHLKKFYKFVEKQQIGDVLQDVIVDKIKSTNEEIYYKISNNNLVRCTKEDGGSFLVGTSGIAEFFFTDDSNKNNTSDSGPVLIFAELDLSRAYDYYGYKFQEYDYLAPLELSYLNYAPAVLPIIKTRYNPAASLTITTNGLDGEGTETIDTFNIDKISYANTKIPFVLKLKDQDNYTTKSYPYLSALQTGTLSSYYFKLALIDNNNTVVPSVSFYKTNFEDEIFDSGGFWKGYLITDSTVLSAKLSATVYIDDIPNFEQDTAFIFYSQPYTKYLARYYKSANYTGCSDKTDKFNTIYDFLDIDSRSVLTITQIPSSNSTEEDYCSLLADTDTDRILKIDFNGTILNTIVLSACIFTDGYADYTFNFANAYGSVSPVSIALDSENNYYVACFDSGYVLKFDSISNKVVKIYGSPSNTFTTSANYVSLSGFVGELLALPSCVETDKNDNLLVCYSHPLLNYITKFNTLGDTVVTYNFPKFFSPQKIIVDRNNDIWVTVQNLSTNPTNINNRNDLVYKFNNNLIPYNGVPLSGFNLPTDITVDGSQNCWVSHGTTKLSKITNDLSNVYTFNIGSIFNTTSYIQSIEGISCNSENDIVVVNNYDRKIYFVPAEITTQPDVSSLVTVNLSSAPTNFVTYPLSAFYDSKYQADGDFLGFNWINKFYYFSSNKKYITGTSQNFNIYPASGYNLAFLKNENFDGEKYYESLALMETLQDKPGFFKNFLGTIVGDYKANLNDVLLKKIYSTIANFTNNIADVEVCTVESLKSKCDMFDVEYDQFSYPIPPSMRRIIDIMSIKRNTLFGVKNKSNYNFNLTENIGSLIDIRSSTFSGSEILLAKEKFSGFIKPVNTTLIEGISTYNIIPLSTFNYDWGWGLVVPKELSGTDINEYYEFYRLIQTPLSSQVVFDNYLDFNNPNTTITFSDTGFDIWYGKNGIIDENIAFTFTKGLNLFTNNTAELSSSYVSISN
jgi:hypothetical protein